MGSYLSYNQTAINHVQQTINGSPDIVPTTKTEALELYGSPESLIDNMANFEIRSMEEETFLSNGGRELYTERGMWILEGNKRLIIYFKDETILRRFQTEIPKITVFPKTKQEVYEMYGDPKNLIDRTSSFCAHSYDEDMFLINGGRNGFTERGEWILEKERLTVYFRGDDIIKLFFTTNNMPQEDFLKDR